MASSSIFIELNSVPDCENMSCAQLALCAATGKTRAEVNTAIMQAAQELQKPVADLNKVNTQIWRSALELLGFVAIAVPFDHADHQLYPNVDAFMAGNANADVHLVVSVDDLDRSKDHVFAAQEKRFVDINTKGRVSLYTYRAYEIGRSRVDHIIHVRRRV